MKTQSSWQCVISSKYLLAFALAVAVLMTQAWADESLPKIQFKRYFPSLSFEQPTALLQEPKNDDRFYVLEKTGRIYYFKNRQDVDQTSLYLDISNDRVDSSYEGGLLGMAYDPGFESNRIVYLSYTSSDNPSKDDSKTLVSRISRFRVNQDNSKILPDTEEILITIDQPWNNHNGGQISFGPDGYLYAGFGDGGSWGDPNRNSQNTNTLLGSILRVDVRLSKSEIQQGMKYKIPADNPFAKNETCINSDGCPEIFAWGFRNPWRWSFDRMTGDLWAGDVGQGDWEEIDLVVKGGNYGWNCFEGNTEYRLKLCDKEGQYILPRAVYSHLPAESRDGRAASVTGGYVYRGEKIPELRGQYLYADYVHGILWRLPDPYSSNSEPVIAGDTDYFIVSFAEDNYGEVYFLDFLSGAIYGVISSNDQQ